MTICAVVTGAEGRDDVELFALTNEYPGRDIQVIQGDANVKVPEFAIAWATLTAPSSSSTRSNGGLLVNRRGDCRLQENRLLDTLSAHGRNTHDAQREGTRQGNVTATGPRIWRTRTLARQLPGLPLVVTFW